MSQPDSENPFVLEDQIGFRLRLANQRHQEIFAATLPDVTHTQFATLVKLRERGVLSQNHLGRLVAMDAATTNGVITRLRGRCLVHTQASPNDLRRLNVSLTPTGETFVTARLAAARDVSSLTLRGLTQRERRQILALLAKIAV